MLMATSRRKPVNFDLFDRGKSGMGRGYGLEKRSYGRSAETDHPSVLVPLYCNSHVPEMEAVSPTK